MHVDLGDITAVFELRVKGLRAPRLVWRIGATADVPLVRRVTRPGSRKVRRAGPRKVDLIMDLQADKQVPLSVAFADEAGNPVPTPADATVTYTVDDAAVITLTDNGDGTAVAAATGLLGTATVHVDVDSENVTLTGDLSIVVVEGLAERVNVVAGEPAEVTPDTAVL